MFLFDCELLRCRDKIEQCWDIFYKTITILIFYLQYKFSKKILLSFVGQVQELNEGFIIIYGHTYDAVVVNPENIKI